MFGKHLQLARKKAGYSLRGLSYALDGEVTAQAIGKYERGEMMPRSSVLIHLASALGVSLEYLLSERVEALKFSEFRKHSGMSAGDRAHVEAAVIDSLQRYFAIEEILSGNSGNSKAPRLGNRWLGHEDDGEVLAQNLRQKWQLGIDPIPNMTALLEDRGIKVLMMPLPDRVSGLTCFVYRSRQKTRVPVIIVNAEVSQEKRRFTLAHELAPQLIDKTSPVDREKASDIFAGAFLMPKDHLMRAIGERRKAVCYRELIQIKRIYRVSAATLLVRLKQVGIIDQSTFDYAFRTFARGWRKSEPESLKGNHEVPQRFERLCYWALAEKFIDLGKACELLQKPLADIEKGLKGPARGDADSG